MQRVYPILALGLLTLCAAATAMAGDVYQWKDAHGVTQYTHTPPAKGAYKVRMMHDDQVQLETAPAKPTENAACVSARSNIQMLQGKAAIRMDSDGDGKPDKTLSDDDRSNQMQLAQATVKVACAGTTAASDKATSAGQ